MKLRKVLSLFVALVMMLEVLPLSSFATEIADATENVEVSEEVVSEETETEEVAEDSEVGDDTGTSSEVEAVIDEEVVEQESTILLGASASESDEDSSDELGIATVSDDATTVASGTCGDDLTWILDSDGVLTISGTGDMEDYSLDSSTPTPWDSNKSSIVSLVIEFGVTSIGKYAFYRCINLASVTIPNSVTSIGTCAFYNCTSLANITIPSSVTSIGSMAFYNVSVISGSCGNDLAWAFNSDNGVLTISGTGDMADYSWSSSAPWEGNSYYITSVVIESGVTSIGNRAFYYCTNLASVTIPDSVTSIGSYAFSDCTSLTSVTIPNGVTSIGNYAFSYCTGLVSVVIPDSVTSIGSSAFYKCTNLESVNIPDSVTSVGNNAFYDCTSLESITIPDSVTSVGSSAFYNVSVVSGTCGDDLIWTLDSEGTLAISGTGDMTNYSSYSSVPWYILSKNSSTTSPVISVVIESGVTSISNYAFYNCTSLTSITISDSVTSIGQDVFYGCSSLASVTIPDSVTSIGNYTFRNCTGLTSMDIPDSVTSIGNYAFYNCTSLTSITIPDSVTSIGNYAFYNCTSLTSITIPDSVTSTGRYVFYDCTGLTTVTIESSDISIGYYSFTGCSNLTYLILEDKVTDISTLYILTSLSSLISIEVSDDNTQYSSLDGVLFNKDMSELILCPRGKSGSCAIPDSFTSICDSAFYKCINLEGVTIPDSVASIGESAFDGCSSLTNLDIGDGVTSIGNYAFRDCTSLESVIIPDSVTDISSSAFSGCTGLISVTIPDSITSISSSAFYGCTGLTRVTIPDSVTSIGRNAFCSCTGLTSVTIGSGVTSIAQYAFAYCSSLTSVTIPDNVTKIDRWAFCGCTGLTSVTIPDSVTSIGEGAFMNCTSLTSVTIPDSVTSMSSYVFYGCTDLTSVAIGSGLTYISTKAFSGCTKLTSVTILDSVTSIAENAFEDCESITDVYYSGTTSEWNEISINSSGNSYLLEAIIHCSDGVLNGYAINIADCENGSTNASASIATEGKLVRIYVSHNIGYQLLDLSVVDANGNEVEVYTNYDKYTYAPYYTFIMPASDVTVMATFEKCGYLIDVVDSENGSVSASASNATEGDEITLTVSPDNGYRVSGVSVIDSDGNEIELSDDYAFIMPASDVTVTATFESGDDEAPVAIINPTFLVAGTGVDFQFSGTSSTDNIGVATYYWDFGDGSNSSASAPLHAYLVAGTYTVSLTVADASGNSDTVQAEIQVVDIDEDSDYAIVEFTVVDSSTAGIVSGAIMQVGQVIDDDGSCEIIAQLESDSTGYAVAVLEKGTYNISVTASGYMPKTVVVNVDESGEYTIAISTTSLVVGEITATEMTYDEIVDAGIDVDAEENQHVWKFEATLSFTVGLETFDVDVTLGYSNSDDYTNASGGWHSATSSSGALYTFGVFPMMTEGFCLVVYGEAHWLKEMYNVELIVMNESQVETIEDCVATLSLPEGMSLATMVSDQQSLTIDLGTIGIDETSAATWYLCGDEEGEYYLTADVTGNWVTENVSSAFSETFTTSEPVKVYAGTALHLYIEAEDVATRGEGYKVTFRLENVSDKSLYNLSFGVTNVEQYKTISASYDGVSWSGDAAITSADFDDSMMRTVSELAPGGYIEITIEVTCWFNSIAELAEVVLDTTLKSELPVGGSVLAALINVVYYLQDVQVVTLEGSTTSIPYSVSIKETDKDNLVDVIIKNAANEVLDKAFGIDTGGTLGATLIKVIGKEVGVDSTLISGAKAILSLAQGETDYTFEITMDDGLQEGDSISNEYLTVTFGTPQSAVWDTLNGTKVTYKGGDITIQAKLPGSTSLKIAVKNSLGDLETELTFNVTTEDTVLKDKITLSQDETKGSFRMDENSLDITVNKNVREIREVIDELLAAQLNVYESNPFAYFDSELIIDVSGTTSDNSFDYTLTTDLDVINGSSGDGFRSSTATTSSGGFRNSTATTLYTISNGSSLVSFSADAFYDIADTTADEGDSEFTLAITRLSVEEAALFGFGEDTYSFDITTESGTEISDFGGNEVTITLPYVLPDGADADDIVVIHLNENDGTYETIDATYDEEAQTVTFVTTHFSIYSIELVSDPIAETEATLSSTDWTLTQSDVESATGSTTADKIATLIDAILAELDIDDSVTVTYTITDITEAIAGDETDPDGTDGSFTINFTISASNELDTLTETGTVTATAYVHTHTLTHFEAVEATCGNGGNPEYWYCADCGKYYSDENAENEITQEDTVITTTDHTYGEPEWTWTWSETEQTYTVTAKFTCEVCGGTDTETALVTSVTTDATCTATGSTVYTAVVDMDGTAYSDTKTVELPMVAHTKGEAVTENEVAATCTTDGSYDTVVYCSVCGEKLSRETITVPATGHTTEIRNAVDATCTEDGYTGDEVCTVCGETITVGTVIPATGHSFNSEGVCEACGAKTGEDGTASTVTVDSDDTIFANVFPSGLVTSATISISNDNGGTLVVSTVVEISAYPYLVEHIADTLSFTLYNKAQGDDLISETNSFTITSTENNKTVLKKVTILFYGDIDYSGTGTSTVTMDFANTSDLSSSEIYVLHYTGSYPTWEVVSSTVTFGDTAVTVEFEASDYSPFVVLSVASASSGGSSSALDILLRISANYSAVTEAIDRANALNPSDYENFSAVTEAINAVNWNLKAINQLTVNAYADAINTAIDSLVETTASITEETVNIDEPIEDTNTDTEDDDEEKPSETSEPESNPTTGIALSVLPMMIVALATASSKRR